MAGSKSKNNPQARQSHKSHIYNGEKVKPVLYDGRHVGYGKYYAMEYEGNKGMVRDESGRPLAFSVVKGQ